MNTRIVPAILATWCALSLGLWWESAALAAPPAGYTADGKPFWMVVPEHRARDEKEGIVNKSTGAYPRNDTVKRLVDLIDASGRIGLETRGKEIIYGVDLDGNIIVGTRLMSRQKDANPHPTLIGGTNPAVLAAGTLELRDGKIFKITDDSGHFQPDGRSLPAAKAAFSLLPTAAFHPDFSDYDFRPEEGHRGEGPAQGGEPRVGGVSMNMKVSGGSFAKPQDGSLKKFRNDILGTRMPAGDPSGPVQDKNQHQQGD